MFLSHLKSTCKYYSIDIYGYVIMPEHIHLVLYPRDEVSIGRVIGELKSKSAREILLQFRRENSSLLSRLTVRETTSLWQKRCYDHNCRTPETVIEKINYCHKNPVTRGLVNDPEDWKWSSYRWYEGMDDVAIEIEGYEC
jgi:putative transposase